MLRKRGIGTEAFCFDSGINIEKTNKKSFEVTLTIKNIPGVSKKQNTTGRKRVFDLVQLREYFQIEFITDEPLERDDPE